MLAGLLLLGMLGSCQNEDALVPQPSVTPSGQGNNAKTSALVPSLTEDGDYKLKYITSGRYQGRLSHVIEPTGHTLYYGYSDGSDGDLWITAKRQSNTSGAYTSQVSYHVVNGRCIKSTDITNNKTYTYQYNETGRLDKISLDGSSDKREFTYTYNSTTQTERLTKITYSNSSGKYKEVSFSYVGGAGAGSGAAQVDKYFLNPEHTELDKYQPLFGKLSDVLVRQVTVTPFPYNGQLIPYYTFEYFFNANGYVTSRWRQNYPFGYGNLTGMTTNIFALKYGYPGQGI